MKRKTEEEKEHYDVTETECVVCGCELHTTDDAHHEFCEADLSPEALTAQGRAGTERCDICEDCFNEFLENIGQKPDDVTETPHPLNAEQWQYLDRIVKHSRRSPVPRWVKEHGAEYDIPPCFEANPRLEDNSWHNDASPSFDVVGTNGGNRFTVRVWVLHPNAQIRAQEFGTTYADNIRFSVYAMDEQGGKELYQKDHETPEAAIADALRFADELRAKHPEAFANSDAKSAPEAKPDFHAGNPRFVWNVGAIREQFTDMPEQDTVGTLVLWDRQERKAVVTVSPEYSQALCLECTTAPDHAPFTTLENWFNQSNVADALASEGIRPTLAPYTLNA